MQREVTIDGQICLLQLERRAAKFVYRLSGGIEGEGEASVTSLGAGQYSILLGTQSFTVQVAAAPDGGLAVWRGNERHEILVSDTRDRVQRSTRAAHHGPLEIRALMPGRVVRVLVATGEGVALEQPLVVVEAMKMQNEIKAPREGVVRRIAAVEGATVAAGEALLVIE